MIGGWRHRDYERRGTHGAASSTHHLATRTAMAVLARGGNAFDAVVAARVRAAGGGAAHVRAGRRGARRCSSRRATRRRGCCAARGWRRRGATTALLRDELGLDAVPGTGLLPATVPGAWDGWLTLLRDHGTLSLAEVLDPALGYAARRVPAGRRRCRRRSAPSSEHFREHWPSSAATWLPDGRVPTTVAPAARARRHLAPAARRGRGPAHREAQIDAARAAWYRGFVAEEIERVLPHAGARRDRPRPRGPAHRRRPGGLVGYLRGRAWSSTSAGAGRWPSRARGRRGRCSRRTCSCCGTPTSRTSTGVPTEATVHRGRRGRQARVRRPGGLVRRQRRPSRWRTLLSRDVRRRAPGADPATRRRWSCGRAPPAAGAAAAGCARLRGGTRGARSPSATGSSASRRSARTGATRGDTVHIDVVDAAGNMVSATPSGGWLQSSPTIPALGFCLGTRAQMFWLEDGLASSLVPGRRPRTTLSPSLGLRDGEPVLAFGTPGGDQQDQWQLCFWLAHTVGGLDLQAAIDAPTWHSTAFPSSFAPRGWEPRRARRRVPARRGRRSRQLRRRGHDVVDAGPGRWAGVRRGPGRPPARRRRPPQRLRRRRGLLRVSGAGTGRGSPSPAGGCAGRTPSGDPAR